MGKHDWEDDFADPGVLFGDFTTPEMEDFADDEDDKPEDPDLEAAAKAKTEALQTDFQKRAKNEEQRFYDAVDSEFWIAVCFQTREQKEEFLEKKGWLPYGDKYLDGRDVAKVDGVKLTEAQPPRKTRPISKKLTDLA